MSNLTRFTDIPWEYYSLYEHAKKKLFLFFLKRPTNNFYFKKFNLILKKFF